MKGYLDTSVLMSMFTTDDHSARVARWLLTASDRLTLSEWTLAEFTSALAVGRRVGRLRITESEAAEAALASWLGHEPHALSVLPDDIPAARQLIRSTTMPLRAADALHLEVCRRNGAAVVTVDLGMARAARDLGLPVEDL